MPSIDNVYDVTPRIQYVASPGQTAFDYPFPIFEDVDLAVDVDGVTQALTTDYTVSGEGEETGGTVTFLSAMAGNEIVTIYRDIPIDRLSDFQQNGPYSSVALNDELDRMTLVMQQLQSGVNRSLRFPVTSEATAAQTEFDPVSNWLEKFVYINASGIPEPATAVATSALTQATIGSTLYPQTAAELAAGVTPTNYQYPPGNVLRYGTNAVPGTTNMNVAIQAAIDQATNGGAAVYLPAGTYLSASQLEIDTTDGITMYGDGYRSVIKGSAGGTYIILLAQKTGYTALNGLRLSNFRIDGNSGGQLDAGLLQVNNAVNMVLDKLWVANGTRVSGSSGVNGIAVSAGTLGGQGSSGSINDCVVTNCSKAGFNISTESVNITARGCISYLNTGNGTAPGFQIFGGYYAKFIDCTAFSNEGAGFFIGTSGGAGTYRYPKECQVSGCHAYLNGTGATEGHGIFVANAEGQASGVVGRIILSGNTCSDNGVVATDASGIRVENQDDLVLGTNLLYGNAASGLVVQNCRRVTVSGGEIASNNVANATNGSGILVQTSGSSEVEQLTVQGVQFRNAGTQKYPLFFHASNPAGSVLDFQFLDNSATGHETSDFVGGILPKRSHVRHTLDATTADATNTTVWSVTLEDDSAYSVVTRVLAKESDGSNRNLYHLSALAYRDGAGATLQGAVASIHTEESNAAWDSTIIVASNSLGGRVTGEAATDINWHLSVELVSQ